MAITIAVSLRSIHIFSKPFLLIQCNNIRHQPVCPRHPRRQFPEEYQPRIYENPFPISSRSPGSPSARSRPGPPSTDTALISRIHLTREIDPPLLYPVGKVLLRYRIGKVQHLMIRQQEIHLRCFIRDPDIRQSQTDTARSSSSSDRDRPGCIARRSCPHPSHIPSTLHAAPPARDVHHRPAHRQ